MTDTNIHYDNAVMLVAHVQPLGEKPDYEGVYLAAAQVAATLAQVEAIRELTKAIKDSANDSALALSNIAGP